MLRATLAASLAVTLAGCSPQLRDGTYGCPDGRCPASLAYCWARDQLCHATPETAAVDTGVPPVDMGPGAPDMGGGGTCGGTVLGSCAGAPLEMCVVGQWAAPPAMPSFACARGTEVANALHGTTCTPGPGACTMPDACVVNAGTSRCMRPCGPPTDPCGFGESCVTLAGGAHVCVPPCNTTGPPCPMFGLTCSAAAGNHCVPPGW